MTPASTIHGPMTFTLRLIGIWPGSTCNILQRVLWTIVMLVSQLFQYWYLFMHIGSDSLPILMHSLSLCISNSLLYLKLNILWLKKRFVYNIITTRAEDWIECASARSKMQTMVGKAILSHRFSNYIIGMYSVTIILLSTNNILAQRNMDSDQSAEERLLVKMRLPFEYNASPLYEIVMVVQFLLQYTLALTAGMLHALIVALVLHIAGQIDIMCHELLKIPVAKNKHEMRVAILKALVSQHHRIITFVDNIENMSCYMALMQFFSNRLTLCFLGFLIITSLDPVVLIKCIPYYVIINLEAFILCFTGEYLNSKSKSINSAAYKSLWYELKPVESRILLLLMMRSQKQLSITIGKFMDLSLESFTSILKASAWYISVLRVMY